jgi:hypothetical protein
MRASWMVLKMVVLMAEKTDGDWAVERVDWKVFALAEKSVFSPVNSTVDQKDKQPVAM